ncbi:hypothetical protein J6590_051112 [Homalodisca vitripennis]|nr:hypothetical protein J6590_051112 [Homalodisca vitripennis]
MRIQERSETNYRGPTSVSKRSHLNETRLWSSQGPCRDTCTSDWEARLWEVGRRGHVVSMMGPGRFIQKGNSP